MLNLTQRQRQILDFIETHRQESGAPPTLREIAGHFGFKSMTTAVDHVRLLRNKGALSASPGRARSLQAVSPLHRLRGRVADIPVFGSIPAGRPEDQRQEARGCLSIDIQSIGIKPTPRTFALEVRGDSMIGRHILDGDLVVLEHGMTPRNGDVVAALVDNESTLKTFVQERGRTFLKAENPKYPDIIPAAELVVQGVMLALVRKRK